MEHSTHPPFDSVILAGGFGSRMSPLTDSIPKPLLPVGGIPAFLRILGSLRRHGFVSTAVTTMYLADQVESCAVPTDGSTVFFREKDPLGSAGAVRALKPLSGEVLLIISGDAVCDFDFSALKKEFLASGACGAVILRRSSRVQEYGSVSLKDGFITAFCEKPSCRDILSDLVSTGIYFLRSEMLSLIPENTFFDFGKDLFPMLVKKGVSILGAIAEGSWFDIGSFGAYFDCNMHLSGGKSCIGKGVRIHPSALVEKSVLFDGVQVGNSVVKGSILAKNTLVEDECTILPGCVLGEGSVVKRGAFLNSGTVLPPKSTVCESDTGSWFCSLVREMEFIDDGVMICDNDENELGKALAKYSPLAIGCDGSAVASLKCESLALSVRDFGGDCVVCGECSPTLIAFAARNFGGGAHLSLTEKGIALRLFDQCGLPFSSEKLRAIPRRMAEKILPPAKKGKQAVVTQKKLMEEYCLMLRSELPDVERVTLGDVCGEGNEFFCRVVSLLGTKTDPEGDLFFVSPDGKSGYALTSDGREVSHWHLYLLCCLLEERKKIFLPSYTPACVERILRDSGAEVLFFGDGDSEERNSSASDLALRDGCFLCLKLLCLLKKRGLSLSCALCSLPPFAVTSLELPFEKERIPSLLGELRKGKGRLAGFDFNKARVNVMPCARGIKLYSEAVSFEMAEEFAIEAINELLKL